MNDFTPYIYEIGGLPSVTIKKIEDYFNHFTFLDKPDYRNVYKLSLGQLINYMVKFGIGYDSVCTTSITNQQEFKTTMYVNRHESTDPRRPATVSDLKEKLLSHILTLMETAIQKNNNNRGVKVTNKIYPKYFFTLDTELTPFKLKQLTGKEYVEVDFTDFPFTKTSVSSSTITRENGYIPADSLLMCPAHNHGGDVNSNMQDAISYNWNISLDPDNGIGWVGHVAQVLGLHKGAARDDHIKTYWNVSNDHGSWPVHKVCQCPSMTPNWQFPTSVSCHLNDKVYPPKTKTINGVKYVSIRFPGRRYRLFKQVED